MFQKQKYEESSDCWGSSEQKFLPIYEPGAEGQGEGMGRSGKVMKAELEWSKMSLSFLHLFFWFPEQIDNDYFKVCIGQFQFLDQLRFFFLLLFLWPHRQHMEVPRLEVQSELQPPATATAIAIATPDPSCIRDLYPDLWQHLTLNPQSKARDRTHILMDTKLGS